MACQAKNIYCVALPESLPTIAFYVLRYLNLLQVGVTFVIISVLIFFLFFILINTYKLHAYKLSEPGESSVSWSPIFLFPQRWKLKA